MIWLIILVLVTLTWQVRSRADIIGLAPLQIHKLAAKVKTGNITRGRCTINVAF